MQGSGPTLALQPSSQMADNLSRLLDDLCRKESLERRREGERALQEFVEAEARDLSAEAFSRFMVDIYVRIQACLSKGNDIYRRLGAVLAIDELIEVKIVGDDAIKTQHFARLLHAMFADAEEPLLLEVGSQTLGHLVRAGGAMTADIVEREVSRCLPWLQQSAAGKDSSASEARRYAAVLILRQLADNAPAVFNVHVAPFIDAIWGALRDARVHVREAAVLALRSCLVLVEKRETRYRVQWYYKLFERTMRCLNRDRGGNMPTAESIHGALLALGELLRHTGEFLLARYREVVETVLRFKDSKEKLIRRAVITLLPRLAAFAPERFAQDYLSKCIGHLLSVLKHTSERGAAFSAIADMATSLAAVGCAGGFEGYLPGLAQQIKEAVAVKGRAPRTTVPEALQCVGALSQALGSLWRPYAQQLLEAMILTGLSDTLVASLQDVAAALPELLEDIQAQLLDLLSLVLARRPFNPSTSQAKFTALGAAVASSELSHPQLVRLALATIGNFDFGRASLLDFMRDHILVYIDADDKEVRQGAALACCRVLERHASSAAAGRRSVGLAMDGVVGGGLSVRQARAVEAVVHKLLVTAVADTSERVRKTVLRALYNSSSLDDYLAQADCLRPLFVALNDESVAVRATAVRLVGRLADWNPAYVAPALRRHLLQLLSDMEHSPDSKHREESAYLLDCLIASAHKLIMPYISPIQKALVSKLRGANANAAAPLGPMPKDVAKSEAGVVKSVLATLGQLATVAGTSFKPYVYEVMPLVIEAIADTSSARKRIVAVRSLGQIVRSSGCVMAPYMDFPQLLAMLLRMLHEGGPLQRREVIRVLGIVGALDPHTHKINTASLSGEGKLELEGVRPLRHATTSRSEASGSVTRNMSGAAAGGGATGDQDWAGDLLPAAGLVTSSEDYYPTVAINALMRVLRDPSLSSQHQNVIAALMTIFRSLGVGSVPYLPKVLPVLFGVVRSSDEPLRQYVFEQLTCLTRLVRQHIRRFLPEVLGLVHDFWGSSGRITHYCLQLLAELSLALRDDFRAFVPELLPKFVGLFVEAERTGQFDMVKPALAALEALGSAVEEHLHLLLPALVRLISPATSTTPPDIRRAALRSTRKLLPRMQLAGYASAILHPLIKVLDGPSDELRADALTTICAMAVALGPDFSIFVPSIRKAMARHRLSHEWFERIAAKLASAEPPCMSDAEDWESAAGGWAAEIDALNEASSLSLPLPGNAVSGLENGPSPGAGPRAFAVNTSALRKAWESSARVTKDDWAEWMRHFSVELLAQSPSPALRACHALAQVHPNMARELFAAGFVSCWNDIDAGSQAALVRSLEAALAAPTIPPEIVTALLNLAEFMEHDDKRLPLDTRTLGALAEKCHAFAKALHYKEAEFQTTPQTAIEALIHINNQLRQPEAAVGVLTYAQKNLHMELKESWYEKLCRWDEALDAYQRRLEVLVMAGAKGGVEYHTALLGKMRCLASLAEWDTLSALCRREWTTSEPHMRKEIALIAAHAAWHMHQWDDMAVYVDTIDTSTSGSSSNSNSSSGIASSSGIGGSSSGIGGSSSGIGGAAVAAMHAASGSRTPGPSHGGMDLGGAFGGVAGQTSTGAFLRAVLCVRHSQFDNANVHIERARELMSTELAALVGESYERAYTDMIRVQQLTELEEVISYKRALARRPADAAGSDAQIAFIKELWRKRLMGAQRHVEVWQALFSVRSLVVPMNEDVDNWIKFASLCRKSGRTRQAKRMLLQLLGYEPKTVPPGQPRYGAGSGAPGVMLAYLKHMWASGDRTEAFARLQDLVGEIVRTPTAPPTAFTKPDLSALSTQPVGGAQRWHERPRPPLNARAYLRLGMWEWTLNDALDPGTINSVMGLLRSATEYGSNWAKAWHQWALFNCAIMNACIGTGDTAGARRHVATAVTGFFRSVALGQAAGDRTGNLQDVLRLLTLWFNHGSGAEAEAALQEGFALVSIDTWLVVIPQIIARIHTNNPQVRGLIHSLLVRIGRHHPQALMYPLLVACKSQSPSRRAAAYSVLEAVRQHSATLVEQAQLVSQELIRIAILWHEMWHEALEEASRLYFGESNVEAMLATLLPLHEMMEKQGPTTLKEIAFVQAYGRELSEAYEWLMKYRSSRKEAELHQAWDLYYHVFKRINKQLHSLTTLELQYVAPALVRATGMELAVPGTYIAGEPLVTIAAFAPQLQVISSKQRPRKLTIHGGDGAEYMFLLKGHEDLRQDERVMQLFGLVNTMLANDRTTAERDLSIARYAVIPLSPNSGLIGWVPNCDTLHALIREYREARKVPLNWEHRLMLGMAPDYEHLSVIHKVEVFEYALDATSGEDLHKVLWLKSRNSEVWLDRRTSYTRSTAVMSMVGYLLGLGDRHPSNLMLDRYSGKLLHIDFGDCFEASMNREKFPEKVPFRLTRMMIKAMEVSGIEGNFRTTAENVMRVLRSNKDSVMAMLEAFVHDPLINWRLLNTAEAATETALGREAEGPGGVGPVLAGAVPVVVPPMEAANGIHHAAANGPATVPPGLHGMPSPPQRGARERELREARDQLAGDASEVLNERAVAVMKRMTDKLMGRDYLVEGAATPAESDTVAAQVQRLIGQAVSHENLCQSYIGWCPFW